MATRRAPKGNLTNRPKKKRKKASKGKAAKRPMGVKEKLEAEFVSLCEKHPEGLREEVMREQLVHIPLEDRATIINSLLQRGRLSLYQHAGSIVYKIMGRQDAVKFRGLGPAEMLVYQLIERSGNMGIWIRDIRHKSNLQQTQIAKILKTLMGVKRKLVKCEKSVTGGTKKLYMLYHLQPAKELSGGVWYSEDGHFDQEFIDALYQACLGFCKSKGQCTAKEVSDFVRQSGAFTVTCSLSDIQNILLTLYYDGALDVEGGEITVRGMIKHVLTGGGSQREGSAKLTGVATGTPPPLWIHKRNGYLKSSFASFPYALYPVAAQCSDTGIINPKSCEYMSKWMEY